MWSEMKQKTSPKKELIEMPNGNGVLTLPEVAKKLRVSRTWLYKKCEAGLIPHLRIGKMVRFVETDILDWMKTHHKG